MNEKTYDEKERIVLYSHITFLVFCLEFPNFLCIFATLNKDVCETSNV